MLRREEARWCILFDRFLLVVVLEFLFVLHLQVIAKLIEVEYKRSVWLHFLPLLLDAEHDLAEDFFFLVHDVCNCDRGAARNTLLAVDEDIR